MGFETWRALAEQFGKDYGVEVYVGGTQAYSTEKAIYLPSDVPAKMQDAMIGMFLHEKEHILQKDHAFTKKQPPELAQPLNVVQDIRNDHLVIKKHPGAESLYRKIMEYIDGRHTKKQRDSLDWRQKAVLELIQRAYPRGVATGYHFTGDPLVRRFFKKNSVDVRRLLKEVRYTNGRDVLVRWARWLLDRLFPDMTAAQAAKAAGGMGGLVPTGWRMHEFECVSPGDLKVVKPREQTVSELKEFLLEKLEDHRRCDEGAIDPARLPVHWGSEDIFLREEDHSEKAIRVYLLLDSSASMRRPLDCGNLRYEALCRAAGLVCQAAERLVSEHGMEVSVEAWAFGSRDRLVKKADERFEPGTFKKNYWRAGDADTIIRGLVERISGIPEESRTRDVVLAVTDGVMHADCLARLAEAAASPKRLVLIGVGNEITDRRLFRFVANSVEEIEHILVQAVKEASVS